MNVDAFILAAGYSSRANGFKMEFLVQGKPILQRCIESFYDNCNRIIVVSGFRHEKVKSLTSNYSKVNVIYNEDFDKGMFTSVKKGIKNVYGERFFLTPGDYPFISKEIVQKLLNENNEVIVPSYKGKGGHPILLKNSLIEEILNEPQDSNLKIYLGKKECLFLDVDDENILLDVDTIEDYNNINGFK